jgi:hypothetical protein
VLAREDEREKEKGGSGVRRHLYIGVRRCGMGRRKAPCGGKEWGGAWRCTRPALLAGSGPASVGAGGRCLHAWLAPNRGEAGADRWVLLQSHASR